MVAVDEAVVEVGAEEIVMEEEEVVAEAEAAVEGVDEGVAVVEEAIVEDVMVVEEEVEILEEDNRRLAKIPSGFSSGDLRKTDAVAFVFGNSMLLLQFEIWRVSRGILKQEVCHYSYI